MLEVLMLSLLLSQGPPGMINDSRDSLIPGAGGLYYYYPELPDELKSKVSPFFRGTNGWPGPLGLYWQLSKSGIDNTQTRKRWVCVDRPSHVTYSILWTEGQRGYRAQALASKPGHPERWTDLKGSMNFPTFDDAEKHVIKHRRTIFSDDRNR